MRKSSIVKIALCGSVMLAIVATANIPKVSSATINSEKGLAGISITLDKYCAEEAQGADVETQVVTEDEETTGETTAETSMEEITEQTVPAESVSADSVSGTAIEAIPPTATGPKEYFAKWLTINISNGTNILYVYAAKDYKDYSKLEQLSKIVSEKIVRKSNFGKYNIKKINKNFNVSNNL